VAGEVEFQGAVEDGGVVVGGVDAADDGFAFPDADAGDVDVADGVAGQGAGVAAS
jgi:hypothetical protein